MLFTVECWIRTASATLSTTDTNETRLEGNRALGEDEKPPELWPVAYWATGRFF